MSKAPPIGIDLGTSFSAAAVVLNGKPETIPNEEGHRVTPSFVCYDENNTNIYVGTTADHQGIKHITNFLYDTKRIIGRKFSDAYVQRMKNNDQYRFNIVDGHEGSAAFKIKHIGQLTEISPEEVGSEILKYLKKSASEYLGLEVQDAVISVPAYFTNAQRKATRKAAELAGLKVLRLISEPVAGALYYTKKSSKVNKKLLVYDFGGGTFDVSVIDVNEKEFKVLNVEGDTFLGGRDMDEKLLEHFQDQLKERFGENVIKPRLLRRLKEKCIVLKEKLSMNDHYNILLECIDGSDRDFTLSMTRTDYEQIISELVERSMVIVKECLSSLNFNADDIDEVIVIGGVTRTPMIRHLLRQYFGESKMKTDVNPDEAVALGAAYQAVLLAEEFKCVENIIITEITPLSLGISCNKGLFTKIIEKCTCLPARNHDIFTTTFNNQSSVCFKIFEGERKNEKFNNHLGTLICENLPKRRACEISIRITFILDNDGILDVEGYVIDTKQTTTLTLMLQEHRMCQSEINSHIETAQNNKNDDDIFESFVHIYDSINTVLNHITYDINCISDIDNRKYVETKCSELRKYIEKLYYKTPLKDIQQTYTKFQTSVAIFTDIIDVDSEEPLTLINEQLELLHNTDL